MPSELNPNQYNQVADSIWKRIFDTTTGPLRDDDREKLLEEGIQNPESQFGTAYPGAQLIKTRGPALKQESPPATAPSIAGTIQVANGVFVSKELVAFMQKAKAIGFDISNRGLISTLLSYHADPGLKDIVIGDISDAEYDAALKYVTSTMTPSAKLPDVSKIDYTPSVSQNLLQVLKYATNMGLPIENKDQALNAIVEFLGLSKDDLYDSSVYNELLRVPTDQYQSKVYQLVVGSPASTKTGNYVDIDHLKSYVKLFNDIGFDVSDKTKLLATVHFNVDSKLIKDAHYISDSDYTRLFNDVASTTSFSMAANLHTAAYGMQHVTQLLDVLRDMGFAIDDQNAATQVLSLLKSGGGYASKLADHALRVVSGSDPSQFQELMPSDESEIYLHELKHPIKKIGPEPIPKTELIPGKELGPDETGMSPDEKIHETRKKKDLSEEEARLKRLEKHKKVIDQMLENRGMPSSDKLTPAQQHGAKPPPKPKKEYVPPPEDYVKQIVGDDPEMFKPKSVEPKSSPESVSRNKKPLMTEFASQYEDVSKALPDMNPEARIVEWGDSLKLPIWNESGRGPDVARGGMFVFNTNTRQEGMIIGALDRSLVVATLPSGEIGLWHVDNEKISKSKDQIRSREANVKMALLYMAQQLNLGQQQIGIGSTINDPNNPQSTGTVEEVKQDGTVIYTDSSGQKVTTQPNANIEIVKKPGEGVDTVTHDMQTSTQIGVGGPNMLS